MTNIFIMFWYCFILWSSLFYCKLFRWEFRLCNSVAKLPTNDNCLNQFFFWIFSIFQHQIYTLIYISFLNFLFVANCFVENFATEFPNDICLQQNYFNLDLPTSNMCFLSKYIFLAPRCYFYLWGYFIL